MGSSDKIPYSKVIANKVVDGVKSGVSIKDIVASVQSLQNAPSSTVTFYKLYGNLIAETRAEIVGKVGSKVIEQALAGDFKSQELFLRSKGGWSPNATISIDELDGPVDEDTNGIDALMVLLGKDSKVVTEDKEG